MGVPWSMSFKKLKKKTQQKRRLWDSTSGPSERQSVTLTLGHITALNLFGVSFPYSISPEIREREKEKRPARRFGATDRVGASKEGAGESQPPARTLKKKKERKKIIYK